MTKTYIRKRERRVDWM